MLKAWCLAGLNRARARITRARFVDGSVLGSCSVAVIGLGLLGCASPTTAGGFARLSPAEQDRFHRCTAPVVTAVCPGGDEAARQTCLASQAEIFAERPTEGMRRRWLARTGCPTRVMDATAESGAVEQASMPTLGREPLAGTLAAPPAAPAPVPMAQELPAAPAPPVAPAAPQPPAPQPAAAPVAQEAGPVSQPPLPPAAEPAAAPVTNTHDPLPPAKAPEAPAGGTLRGAIVAHNAEMKSCVDRQLKLVPGLRADGTIVIEVDHTGRVVRAGLRGDDLEGTSLEACLRTLALGWRFPRTSRPYAIEAPVKISGSQQAFR